MIAHRRGRVIVIAETVRRPIRLLPRHSEFAALASNAEHTPMRLAVHAAGVADQNRAR